MAHFAEIDSNNIVTRVVVVGNDEITVNGQESEQAGKDFLNTLLGGTWVQTSYNANFRKNFAGIGYEWRSDLDAFIPIKPYNSWTLNTTTAQWDPPVDHPTDGTSCEWDEQNQQWINCSSNTPSI